MQASQGIQSPPGCLYFVSKVTCYCSVLLSAQKLASLLWAELQKRSSVNCRESALHHTLSTSHLEFYPQSKIPQQQMMRCSFLVMQVLLLCVLVCHIKICRGVGVCVSTLQGFFNSHVTTCFLEISKCLACEILRKFCANAKYIFINIRGSVQLLNLRVI